MKPISVGDSVVVVKPQPCCGNTNTIGMIFTVTGMSPTKNHYCIYCREIYEILAVEGKQDGVLSNVNRLKRIPPLSELESTKSSEEITA